jgi:hypothetical protein
MFRRTQSFNRFVGAVRKDVQAQLGEEVDEDSLFLDDDHFKRIGAVSEVL